jgi:hypothetical protein
MPDPTLPVNEIQNWPKLKAFPVHAKALVSAVILTMAISMAGAMGQIIVHDIIPTFFAGSDAEAGADHSMPMPAMTETADEGRGDINSRGDLLSGESVEIPAEKPSFIETEQFVWMLKWTHIHLFGMSMIFIIMGSITVFLDLGTGLRTWLVVLPFAGVLIDIAAVWLKGYISPAFFWLHLPGGGLFGLVFLYVGFRAMVEMWGSTT